MKIFDLPVHPHAEIYPMLPPDEMAELAESILNDGQQQPILVGEHDGETVIVDGRNRREACRIAQVEPKYQLVNGQDQIALIAASNLNRRHMTKSQRAMAMAMHYPEPEKGGRGKKGQIKTDGFSDDYLTKARKVLRLDRIKADQVLNGTESLSSAYDDIRSRESDAESDAARIERLSESHPDLAEQVASETLTLAGAEGEARERESIAKTKRAALFSNLRGAFQLADYVTDKATCSHVAENLIAHENEFRQISTYGRREAIQRLKAVQKNIDGLIATIQRIDK